MLLSLQSTDKVTKKKVMVFRRKIEYPVKNGRQTKNWFHDPGFPVRIV